MMLYKIINPDGSTPQGKAQSGFWKAGEWKEITGELVPCENGLHLLRVQDMPCWIFADAEVWEAEVDGEHIVHDGEKVVCRKARVTKRVGVLDRHSLVAWACDCAERVLEVFETAEAGDNRPREAIRLARIANDDPTDENKNAAYAAYAASAAYTASAAYAASAASAAYYASSASASATAYAAYYATAYAAFSASASAEERTWQGDRLIELIQGKVIREVKP